MSQSWRGIVHPWWSCFLAFMAVIGPTVICNGQGEPAKGMDRSSTRAATHGRISEARTALEAARRDLESQSARGEEETQQAAREYRDEVVRESPDAKKMARLKAALQAAVSAAFKNQLALQKTRLQIAEMDLVDLQARYAKRQSLAEAIVERRVADLISGEDLRWSTSQKSTDADTSSAVPASSIAPKQSDDQRDDAASTRIPNFATPQQLLEFLEKTSHEHDAIQSLRTLFALMEKDELNRFAGFCLRTATLIGSAGKVAEGFSPLTPEGQNAEIIRVGRELTALTKKSRLSKPPRAAQAAYEEISASPFSALQLLLGHGADDAKAPAIDVDVYSAKLRKAAGILKDPMQYIIDFSTLIMELQSDEQDESTQDPDSWKPTEWKISVEADKVIAVDPNATKAMKATKQSPFAFSRLEMVKVGDTWKISNLITDDEIIEAQQGFHRSKSSDSDK